MDVHPTEAELARAAEIIRAGGLVAFPTETVYGLGANALNATAVSRIFKVKGRPWASPLIVHVSDEKMARSICTEWPSTAHRLATKFWPGPLTLVLKKADLIPDVVTANLDSVGVRIPSHPVALELIKRAGLPIAAPSANRFTEISPTTAQRVRETLGDRLDMILDGGPTTVGIESTVVNLHRYPPTILRPGMITKEQVEEAGAIRVEFETNIPRIVESPGQHPRHYAPRTPFFLLEPGGAVPEGRGEVLPMPAEPHEFAAVLYEQLHKADESNWDWIGIVRPPETPEWTGVLDRLQRASTRE
jgi:L-threonylcarbamoyladenylate synthase